MKKYKNWGLGIAAMVVFTSCSKDFLDRPQENAASPLTIDYTQLSNMYQPVSGVYRTAGKPSPGLIHWMDLGIRAVRGDDYEKGSSASDQSQLTDIKLFHNSYASIADFWGSNNSFNDYFNLVITCNSALVDLSNYGANISSSDAANLKLNVQYKAEVRFIRAYADLIASRIWGNIPIMTSVNVNDFGSVGKTAIADVRKYIMAEMDTCIAGLEDARPNQSIHIGAVTKYSALLLKAKAAADLAGTDNGSTYWATVIDCTDQIINSGKFSLYPDFYQLFKIPGKLCNESLYELQFSDFGTSSGLSVEPDAFWAFQGPAGDQKGSPVSGWGFMTPTQTIVDYLNSRNDSVRFKTTILYCGVNADPNTFVTTPSGDKVYGNSNGSKYFGGKAYLPASQMTTGRTNYGSNNNVRVLRYADALLLNAEAKVRKGQGGDVSFNLVRTRAKLNAITGATLQNILDERRAEFACEWWGERYNDLLRTGTAATVLAGNGFVAGTSEYLPIPQTQINLDPNLGK